MKTLYTSALILCSVLLLAVSCVEKPEPDPVDPGKEEVQPVSKQLTFVLPASSVSGKTKWEAGDKIVVHGEYAADQVTVTLAAGDISSDGKSATLQVDNLYPYVREDCASTLYAGYPAEAVNNLKHCFFYTKFSDTNRPLMAASNDGTGDTFKFTDLCGALSFSVNGDYDSYLLSGNKKETLGYGAYQVKITSDTQNYRQYTEDPMLSLEGKLSKGENVIYIPGGVDLKAGYTIKLKKGNSFVKIFKSTAEQSLPHGTLLALGDITDRIQTYDDPFSSDILDIDKDGNANCYIVDKPGAFKFKAVYGNNPSKFLEDVADAVVLWETWNNDEDVTPGSVIPSVSYAEDYIIFHTPATLRPGNAVVAARAEDGTVLWSWHLWVPKTPITTDSYGDIMGAPLMSRNLGALIDAVAGGSNVDPLSYGLVYQWGRKDPFTAAGSFNSSDQATWAGADEKVAPGQITVEEAIANPRLLGHANDGNWMTEIDETLWSDDGKSIYDPCPPGYRVPARNTNKPFWSSDLTSKAGWSVDGTNGWLTVGEPAAVFPIAGYRDDYDVGGMAKVGKRTLYWTSSGAEAKASGADLRYDKGSFKLGSAPKARLGSVRCVKE